MQTCGDLSLLIFVTKCLNGADQLESNVWQKKDKDVHQQAK